MKYFYDFLFVGGMPDAVKTFLLHKENNLLEATELTREVQKGLLTSYRSDFLSNHLKQKVHAKIASKVNFTFDLIAKELHKHYHTDRAVQRFRLKSLGDNTTYSRVSNIFDYLVSSGLTIRANIIRDPSEPLLPKVNQGSHFKCYYWDTGMLNAQLESSYNAITDDVQNSYKGYIAENFIAQHLYNSFTSPLLSWSSQHYEVEFLLRQGSKLYPLEVKASKRSARSPSLTNYIKNYAPQQAFKIAPRNFGETKEFTSIPIYLIEKLLQSLGTSRLY